MYTFDAGTCTLAETTLGSAAKVLRLSQSAASVLRTSDFYENSSVMDSSIIRSLLISDKIIEYDSPHQTYQDHQGEDGVVLRMCCERGIRMFECCKCAANCIFQETKLHKIVEEH